MIKHFEENEFGRDFAVGDIHGCFRKLDKALADVCFDPFVDRLFSVGDMVDRGPQSEEYWEYLRQPWFHAVRGNHEQMVIDAVNDDSFEGYAVGNHFINGGQWLYGLPTVEQQCHAQIFADLPLAIEIETQDGLIGIVHAEVPWGDWDLFKGSFEGNEQMFEAMLMWARTKISKNDRREVKGVLEVYVGHTPVDQEVVLGNVHYIDTGACFGDRKLTLVQFN